MGTPTRTVFLLFPLFLLVCSAERSPADEAPQSKDGEIEKLKDEVNRLRRDVEELKRVAPATVSPSASSEDDELKALRDEASAQAPPVPAPKAQASATGSGGQPAGSGQTIQQRLNAFNPRLTAFGDLIGRVQCRRDPLELDGKEVDDHVSLREVELDIRADVDPYSKAVLILSVSKEHPQDDYGIDVEEGYVTLETLPMNLRLKAGRWRQEFGVANNTHRHDLPWFDYPYPIQELFGPDGLDADAVSLLWLAPAVPLQLQATVLESTQEPLFSKLAREPAYLGRASYFIDTSARSWLQLGSSVLFGKTTPGGAGQAVMGGGDATFKWVKNEYTSFVATGEVFDMRREPVADPAGTKNGAWGAFGALQWQPGLLPLLGWSIPRWYLGVRYDWDNYAFQIAGNQEWAGSAFVSYYATEFLRMRVGFEHREVDLAPQHLLGPARFDTFLFQLTWVFGSHPAEPYWVNR